MCTRYVVHEALLSVCGMRRKHVEGTTRQELFTSSHQTCGDFHCFVMNLHCINSTTQHVLCTDVTYMYMPSTVLWLEKQYIITIS